MEDHNTLEKGELSLNTKLLKILVDLSGGKDDTIDLDAFSSLFPINTSTKKELHKLELLDYILVNYSEDEIDKYNSGRRPSNTFLKIHLMLIFCH